MVFRASGFACASLLLTACPKSQEASPRPGTSVSSGTSSSATASSASSSSSSSAAPAKAPIGVRPEKRGCCSIALGHEGHSLATWGSEGAALRLWDIEHGTMKALPISKDDPPSRVEWNVDGSALALSSMHALTLVDAATGTSHSPVIANIERTAWSPDGTRFLAGSDFGNVDLFDTKTGRSIRSRPALNPNPAGLAQPMDLTWNPDGTVAAIQQDGKTTELWDRVTGKTRGKIPDGAVRFSIEGKHVASVSPPGRIVLAEAHTGAGPKVIRAEPKTDAPSGVSASAFSADGSIFGFATPDAIEVWDVELGTRLASTPRKDAPSVSDIVVGRSWIAFADESDTLSVWHVDPAAPKPLAKCSGLVGAPEGWQISCTTKDPKAAPLFFDMPDGTPAKSPRVGALFVIAPEDDASLVRVSDGMRLGYREVVVDGKATPIFVTPLGVYMGDRVAAKAILLRVDASGHEEPLTDEEIAARERKTLLADFYAGKDLSPNTP